MEDVGCRRWSKVWQLKLAQTVTELRGKVVDGTSLARVMMLMKKRKGTAQGRVRKDFRGTG
jgi:hypothetical protein